MAGIDSDLPEENSDLFEFDLECSSYNQFEKSKNTPASFSNITGDFEFIRKQKIAYWRFIVPVLLIGTLLSAGFYSLENFDKKEFSTSIHQALKTDLEVTEIPHVEEVVILEDTIVQTETIVFEEPPKTEVNIPVAEIKQEEETKDVEILPEPVVESTESITAKVEELVSSEVSIPVLNKVKNFKTENIQEARALSVSTGRYIFVKFRADWCIPCKLMETTALKDESVVKLLNEKFIILDIDIDQARGRKIKEEYYVEQLPTLIVLDDLGNQMKRRESAIGTSGLLEMLESVAQYIYLEEETTAGLDGFNGAGER